jgi:hypothetical protein
MTMDVATTTAVLSALAAVVAAWFAYESARAAKRTNLLAEREHAARSPSLDLYLIRGAIHRLRASDLRVYDLLLRVTNRSDAAIAVTELLLEVEYSRRGERMSRLQVRSDADAAALLANVSFEPFRAPMLLEPRESREGAGVFSVPCSLLDDMQIDRYHIVAVDTNGGRWPVTTIGLNEQVHAT